MQIGYFGQTQNNDFKVDADVSYKFVPPGFLVVEEI